MRMRRAIVLTLTCAALAGCASPEVANDNCTSIISMGGGLLKFCQSGSRLNVSESGLPDTGAVGKIRIVDSPDVLKNLQQELKIRKDLVNSRKIVAKACIVDNQTYINIKIEDLKRILNTAGATQMTSGAAAIEKHIN